MPSPRSWLTAAGAGKAPGIATRAGNRPRKNRLTGPRRQSNISGRACTLFGFPGVSAVGLGDRQLGTPAARDHADPTRLVTLGRGATAHAFLLITEPAFFPPAACHPANAIGLKVFPPNTRTATVVSFSFRACARQGPVFLRVRTTVAGTGIPGFSS